MVKKHNLLLQHIFVHKIVVIDLHKIKKKYFLTMVSNNGTRKQIIRNFSKTFCSFHPPLKITKINLFHFTYYSSYTT